MHVVKELYSEIDQIIAEDMIRDLERLGNKSRTYSLIGLAVALAVTVYPLISVVS